MMTISVAVAVVDGVVAPRRGHSGQNSSILKRGSLVMRKKRRNQVMKVRVSFHNIDFLYVENSVCMNLFDS